MNLNILNYTIKIERNISENDILRKPLEHKRIEDEIEKVKYKYLDYLNIR